MIIKLVKKFVCYLEEKYALNIRAHRDESKHKREKLTIVNINERKLIELHLTLYKVNCKETSTIKNQDIS